MLPFGSATMIVAVALNALLTATPVPQQLHLVPALALAEEQAPAAAPGRRGPRLLEVGVGIGTSVVVEASGFGLAYVAFSLVSGTRSFTNAILGMAIATSAATVALCALPLIVTFVEAWVMGGGAPPYAFAAALGLAAGTQLLAVIVTGASLMSALPLLAYGGLAFGALLSLVGVPVAASWGLHGFGARPPAVALAPEAFAPSLPVAAIEF
jgi:hypothetical protein